MAGRTGPRRGCVFLEYQDTQPTQSDQEDNPRHDLEADEVDRERGQNSKGHRVRYMNCSEQARRQGHPAQEEAQREAHYDELHTHRAFQALQQRDHLTSIGSAHYHFMLHELYAIHDSQRDSPDNDEGRPGDGKEWPPPAYKRRDGNHGWNEESKRQEADEN